jgi:hypothetical protein
VRNLVVVCVLALAVATLPGHVHTCISDPTVTVVYNLTVDMELLKLFKHEGFSFDVYYNAIPSFGEPGEREFVVYKAHYGLATAMVAYDMVVIQAHEEKYDWEKGFKTELTFLRTIGVLEYVDIKTVAKVASWESLSGKNIFVIPEHVEYVSFGEDLYSVSQSEETDYFSFVNRWIAVPGNATMSVEDTVLTVVLFRCGGKLTTDTRRLPVFAPFKQVILVCNSIDYDVTGKELKDILQEKGYTVRRITPQEFDIYRWFSPKIVFLGGHLSPEGMGEIVGRILTETERKMIETTGLCYFSHDDVDFAKQSMLFFAGKDREETREITLLRIDDIVMWLEYIP